MGFGSYDESEQENQKLDTEIDEESVDGADHEHDGDVDFEFEDTSNEELLDRLQDIKE